MYLHVGLHKTGTSAIQSALSLNSKKMIEKGFLYPGTGEFDAHHKLAAALKMEDTSDLFVRFFTDSLRKSNNIIISSEIFSELNDLSALACLNEIFDEINIIVYLRRQDHLIESAYGQIIKQNGETKTLSKVRPYFVDMYKHLNKFKAVLPDAKFILRNYDKRDLYRGDSGKDFFRHVLELDVDEFEWKGGVVNKSLSCVGVELLRRLNLHELKNRNEVVQEIIQASSSLGGKYTKPITGGLMSFEERKELMLECADSNAQLEKVYGFRIPELSEKEELLSSPEVKVFEVLELAISLLSEKYKK